MLLSVLVRLSLGLGEFFIILTVSCVASSAVSTGSDCTAFSTPAKMSSVGMYRGVTAKFRPFCSSEATPCSNFWSLRLITVSVVVFVVGCCLMKPCEFLELSGLAVFPQSCGIVERELINQGPVTFREYAC